MVLVLRVGTIDQRRIVMAAVATLVALPFLLREGTGAGRPEAVAAVTVGGGNLAGRLAPSGKPAPDAGPAAAPAPAATGPDAPVTPITIATPIPEGPNTRRGSASFTRLASSPVVGDQLCLAPDIPRNTKVTVLNLDNGHSTFCYVVGAAPVRPGQVIVLGSSVLEQLADVAQAPIPVRISW